MTDEANNTKERLEALLRRWGAEEALRRAEPPAAGPEARTAGRGTLRIVLLRWGPVAAAAMLLMASVGVYVAGRGENRGVAATPPPKPHATGELRRLRDELAAVQGTLSQREAKVTALAGLADQVRSLQQQIEQQKERHKAELANLLADANSVRQAGAALAVKLTAAEKRVEALEKDKQALAVAAAELPKVRAELAAVEQRLAGATDKIAANRRRSEQAEAALAAARSEMERLRDKHSAVVATFQRTFLASVAPAASGLAARQEAAKARRMLERLGELPEQAENESIRQLLARLEVVLTHLDLLSAERAGSGAAFGRLLRRGGVEAQIDEALAAGAGSGPVRALLLEAKLILMGAGDAG